MHIMTNLKGNIKKTLGNLYGLRIWVDMGFDNANKNWVGMIIVLLIFQALKNGGELFFVFI